MLKETTPVPNRVFDLFLPDLKIAETKALLIIIRQTRGFEDPNNKHKRKERDWISYSQLKEKTGCSKRTLVSAINFLVKMKLIDVLTHSGYILDTPDKRKGKKRLFYRLCTVAFPVETGVENKV